MAATTIEVTAASFSLSAVLVGKPSDIRSRASQTRPAHGMGRRRLPALSHRRNGVGAWGQIQRPQALPRSPMAQKGLTPPSRSPEYHRFFGRLVYTRPHESDASAGES